MLASDLARLIAQGRGTEPADLVISNMRLLDLVSGALTLTDIAIGGDRIVGTYGSYKGRRVIDAKGLIAVPGFIDTHLHVESSLVTPAEFDRCVLRHGVTTAISTRMKSRMSSAPRGWAISSIPLPIPLSICACNCRIACRRPISKQPAPGSSPPICCRFAIIPR